jgi:ferredoxin
MKVITRQKKFDEILRMIDDYGRVFVVGCGTCATACRTGGVEEAADMRERLTAAGKLVTGVTVVSAVCDTPWSLFREQSGRAIHHAEALVVMACGLGVQNVASYEIRPVVPALDTLFLGIEDRPRSYTESCRHCGDCVLGFTAGICPVTLCHKGLLNGPCGGMDDGMCEVGSGVPCAWATIFERLERMGQAGPAGRILAPRNHAVRARPGRWSPGEPEGGTEEIDAEAETERR